MNNNPGKYISILYRKNQIFWAQYLKGENITTAEYPVLISLNKEDGITQDQIVTELCVDKSAVTRAVKSLEEKKFVVRKKDEEDLRCNRIYLTQKGRDSYHVIENGMKEWHKIISADMDENQIEETVRVLSCMLDNIEKHSKKH